jgi:signal transduction histidine kinase
LLTLARTEPGAAPAAVEAVDLGELVRAALADAHTFAHARGSELTLDAAPAARVAGEPAALGALARNLVDNALRYSPPGSRVDVRVWGEDGSVLLRVDDAGPGIPPAERTRVFDRFYRRSTAGEEGTGLGLAIVRSVAARHRAELALDDAPAGGLRVTVRFKAAEPGLTSAPAAPAPALTLP